MAHKQVHSGSRAATEQSTDPTTRLREVPIPVRARAHMQAAESDPRLHNADVEGMGHTAWSCAVAEPAQSLR